MAGVVGDSTDEGGFLVGLMAVVAVRPLRSWVGEEDHRRCPWGEGVTRGHRLRIPRGLMVVCRLDNDEPWIMSRSPSEKVGRRL